MIAHTFIYKPYYNLLHTNNSNNPFTFNRTCRRYFSL